VLETVVRPTAGQPLADSPLRAAAAVGALAGVMSLVAVYGFESLMTARRRRRRQERRDAELGSAGAEEPRAPVAVGAGGGAGLGAVGVLSRRSRERG
jgi:hypothetical protein